MKKEIAARIFLLACTLLSLLASVSGVLSIKKIEDLIFQLLFLPVTLFFVFETISVFFVNKKPLSESLFQGKKGLFTFALIALIIASIFKIISFNKPKEIKEEPSPSPLVIHKEAQATPEPTKGPSITIKTNNPETIVNLRKEPTTTSEIIGNLKSGEEYLLISQKGDWFQIKIDDSLSGWVFKDYVKLNK
jgi:uncharacterized protein YgiM (DUF1202 family)